MKTQILQMMNKIHDHPHLAVSVKFGAGLLAGLVVLYLYTGLSKTPVKDMANAIAEISIADFIPDFFNDNKTNKEEHLAISKPEDIKRYPFFAANMVGLNEDQKNAILKDKPRLSLIIQNIGLNRYVMEDIPQKLPASTTLAVSAYSDSHEEAAKKMRDMGFEIWVNTPSISRNPMGDEGAHALNPTRDFSYNIDLLTKQLEGKSHVTGITIDNDAIIADNDRLWEDISADLIAQGYGILDNTPRAIQPKLFYYNDNRAPYIKGDITLNTNIPMAELKQLLEELTQRIDTQKNLILSVNVANPAALDTIGEWLKKLSDDGITLVPLSAQAIL